MAGLRCLCRMMGPLLRSPGLRGLSAGWANIPWGQEPEGHLPVGKLYGGRFTVTQIPGDGVGPELMGHVERVLSAARAPVEF
eukprot:g20893.t1